MNGQIEAIQTVHIVKGSTARQRDVGDAPRQVGRRADKAMRALFGAAEHDVPLPSVMRFLTGKAQLMALAEQRRDRLLAPVPIRV